jgi:phosphopantothenoylcysteine decarboxylase/phosphopantothenate--cysteine ligase
VTAPEDKGPLAGRKVVLAVTGSIAAYKSVLLARLLVKAGAEVLPVMTASAAKFVGPATFAGITGRSVAMDMWSEPGASGGTFAGELHVALGDAADLVVIAPATADVLARLAHGRADDLVTALALCARGSVLAVPAMHPRMWEHPATQRNVAELVAQGRVTLVGPVSGEVASGDVGMGRMVEPEAIFAAVVGAFAPHDLVGKSVVVTAGPTLEDLDPVRFLGNRSSGKMGFAIAERAAARGAEVTLVTGPVGLPTPHGVRRVDVRSAVAMRGALWQAAGTDLARMDALVMAAAVADYRPSEISASKIKKDGETSSLALVKNPDLLSEIGGARVGRRPVLVGFAVETEKGSGLVQYARRKLVEKKVDLVVANEAGEAFAGDENRAALVTMDAVEELPVMSKSALADVILNHVRARLGSYGP